MSPGHSLILGAENFSALTLDYILPYKFRKNIQIYCFLQYFLGNAITIIISKETLICWETHKKKILNYKNVKTSVKINSSDSWFTFLIFFFKSLSSMKKEFRQLEISRDSNIKS